MTAVISSLHIYPIKSCGAIDLDTMQLDPLGPRFDRKWMLVRGSGDKENMFVTQRDKGCEKLALVKPYMNALGQIAVDAPGFAPLALGDYWQGGKPRRVTVWDDTVRSYEAPRHVNEWFSDFLSQDVRLVQCAPDRLLNDAARVYTDQEGQARGNVRFADGYPLLVTNESSLTALQPHFDKAANITMDRFRANIVVFGLAPFAEDQIVTLETEGGQTLTFLSPCARCKITTIDQDLGESGGKDPLKTLNQYRRGTDENGKNAVFFGMNADFNTSGPKELRVGEKLTVSETSATAFPGLHNVGMGPA